MLHERKQKNQAYHEAKGNIEEGSIKDDEGNILKGLKVYGIPIGSEEYVRQFLKEEATRICKDIKTTYTKMNPRQELAPEVPGRQCLWQLTLRCLQHMGNYWCRHLPTYHTKEFAEKVDNSIKEAVRLALDIDLDKLNPVVQERARLPIKMKGLGVRNLVDRRYSEYMGGVIQGVPPLLDRKTKEDMILPGRLNRESIITLLGENSFMGEKEVEPWGTLMGKEVESELARGIKHAWSYLQSEVEKNMVEIEEIGKVDPEIKLLKNEMNSAGFTNENKIPPFSVTKQVTIELELTRYKVLEQRMMTEETDATFNTKPRERLSFLESCDLSNQFLTALPDVIGIQGDKVLIEAAHTYLGQPSPGMKPYTNTTHYIGRRGHEEVVDQYGDVVARCSLKGGDFWRAHEDIQNIVRDMMKKAGMAVSTHPPNIFHGKIPGQLLDKYLNLHRRQDAIIPDLLVHDYVGDLNAHGANFVEAIFDIKTLRIDKNQKYYSEKPNRNPSKRATDIKTKDVRRDYQRRCEKLDIECTNDNGTTYFADAMKNDFHSGGVHPLVFGAFGETNEGTRELIRLCALLASSKEENADASPIDNTLQKGIAYNIYLTQFKRAIGVMATKTAAQIKLRRTTYIRSSKAEAAAAARPDDYDYYPDHGNHWYSNRQNQEHFQEFYAYQTRNGNL